MRKKLDGVYFNLPPSISPCKGGKPEIWFPPLCKGRVRVGYRAEREEGEQKKKSKGQKSKRAKG